MIGHFRVVTLTIPLVLGLGLGLGLVLTPAFAVGQTTDLANQTLGRGYLHLFIAYAIAWVLVLGWAVAIGRRLARVERRLEE